VCFTAAAAATGLCQFSLVFTSRWHIAACKAALSVSHGGHTLRVILLELACQRLVCSPGPVKLYMLRWGILAKHALPFASALTNQTGSNAPKTLVYTNWFAATQYPIHLQAVVPLKRQMTWLPRTASNRPPTAMPMLSRRPLAGCGIYLQASWQLCACTTDCSMCEIVYKGVADPTAYLDRDTRAGRQAAVEHARTTHWHQACRAACQARRAHQ
jgi:hypothetical protein